MKAESIIKKD
jgi:hypothetical protein